MEKIFVMVHVGRYNGELFPGGMVWRAEGSYAKLELQSVGKDFNVWRVFGKLPAGLTEDDTALLVFEGEYLGAARDGVARVFQGDWRYATPAEIQELITPRV